MTNITSKDIKIEFTKGKGPGGQHRNKTESAVRVTHIPTGISVIRTYDFSRGVVKDHRTKKTASIKNILIKGRLDLINGGENAS